MDCQDLQLILELRDLQDKVLFVPTKRKASGLNVEHSNVQGYEIFPPKLEFTTNHYDHWGDYGCLKFYIKMKRKHGVYVWRYGLFAFVVTVSSLLVQYLLQQMMKLWEY